MLEVHLVGAAHRVINLIILLFLLTHIAAHDYMGVEKEKSGLYFMAEGLIDNYFHFFLQDSEYAVLVS